MKIDVNTVNKNHSLHRYKSTNTGSRKPFRYRDTTAPINTSSIWCSVCGSRMHLENGQYVCYECNSWTYPVDADSQVF